MDETPREPAMAWRFIRAYAVRIVIGTVLLVELYVVTRLYATYRREQRIARKIESVGGRASFLYSGPNWIPQSIRNRQPLFDRIQDVDLEERPLPSDLLEELGWLLNLVIINFNGTQITDSGLEHLKGLTSIEELSLGRTRVTDAGFEHLKQLTRLKQLNVTDTQVTDAGLEQLKGLTNLNLLCLSNTKITDAGLEQDRKSVV